MTLDELLASPEYTGAAPEDRMQRINDWTVTAKQEFPDDAAGLDTEIPKLRALEYVKSSIPALGIDEETAARFQDLYLKAQRPTGSVDPGDWHRYDQAYNEKQADLIGMDPALREKYHSFRSIMDTAGKHYQTGEEAKAGAKMSVLDYGGGVKIPISLRSLADRKEMTVTYPDGSHEAFEYALDEPPPDAARLRKFMVENRPERLGQWGGPLSKWEAAYDTANLGAHIGNAVVEQSVTGAQFGKNVAENLSETLFGSSTAPQRFRDSMAAHFVPLFAKIEKGPDGEERWVRRKQQDYLPDMDPDKYNKMAKTALAMGTGNGKFTDADLEELANEKALRDLVPQSIGSTEDDIGFHFDGATGEEAPGEKVSPPKWVQRGMREYQQAAANLGNKDLKSRRDFRESVRPFDVDPSNLLTTQEDQTATTGDWWGAKAADWLGDKAFNIPTVGQALGSSVPTVAAGLIGGPVAMAPFAGLMGAAEGNSAYEDVYAKNLQAGIPADVAQRRALGAGAAYGAIATVLEQAGSIFELQAFKGKLGKSLPGRLTLPFLPESSEEASQSIAQDLISNANLPPEQQKKAMKIATDSLEAAAGALSFGILPAMGNLRRREENSPAGQAQAEVMADPNLPQGAREALADAGDLSLQGRAQALAEAAKQAVAAPAGPSTATAAEEEAAPAAVPTVAPTTPEGIARATEPVVYSDEEGDVLYQNGAWTLQDGTPAPNAADLEAKRQQYVETGDMPDGMQPAPAQAAPVEAAPIAPAVTPEVTPTVAPAVAAATATSAEPAFQNVVHDSPALQLGTAKEGDHVAEPGYIYRSMSQGEFDDAQKTGTFNPNPSGKSSGGRKNVKHWDRGGKGRFYREQALTTGKQVLVRVPEAKFKTGERVNFADAEVVDPKTWKATQTAPQQTAEAAAPSIAEQLKGKKVSLERTYEDGETETVDNLDAADEYQKNLNREAWLTQLIACLQAP